MRIDFRRLSVFFIAAWSLAASTHAAPPRRAFVMVLDGTRQETLYRLLAAGKLPNIERHLVKRGLKVEHCVTVFPSTTGPAYAPFICGLFPEKSGLAGIRWYDRVTGKSTVYAGTSFGQINSDLTA